MAGRGQARADLIVRLALTWTLNLAFHECHILLLHMPLSLGCSPALNARGYGNRKNTYFLIKESFGNMCCNFTALVLSFLCAAGLAMTFAK